MSNVYGFFKKYLKYCDQHEKCNNCPISNVCILNSYEGEEIIKNDGKLDYLIKTIENFKEE